MAGSIAPDDLREAFSPPVTGTDAGNKQEERQLLELLRNAFVTKEKQERLIPRLCAALEGKKELLFIQVEHDSSVSSLFYWPTAELVESPEVLAPGSRLDRDNSERLNHFRARYPDSESFIFIRYGDCVEDPFAQRTSKLYQVGFIFCPPGGLKDNIDAMNMLTLAARISHHATLNLLFERERYYQKAVRQAVKGEIIKIGRRDDIENQRAKIEALRCNFVPNVTLQPSSTQGQISWFKMTRFSLKNYLDILTSTRSLQDFEVESLTRACFSHLRSFYWKKVHTSPVTARVHLGIGIALAIQRGKEAVQHIKQSHFSVMRHEPVILKNGADLFEKGAVERFESMIQALTSQKDFSLQLEVQGTQPLPCKDAMTRLHDLARKVQHIESATIWLQLQDGSLHGDPHFANFLVDASIPEDPLVFSIDQTKVRYDESQAEELAQQCSLEPNSEFKRQVSNIGDDLLYDVAKLMLSSCCGYGLAYRSAFEIEHRKSRNTFSMKPSRSQIRKLRDVGGISASRLIELDTPVPLESVHYHDVAAKIIGSQLLQFLDDDLEFCGNQVAQNCALLRLWFFTVRHAFSIAEHLFPEHVDRSLAMLLLVTRFVNIGFEKVSQTLDNLEARTDLHKVFALLDELPVQAKVVAE